jgi:hypothetical protein
MCWHSHRKKARFGPQYQRKDRIVAVMEALQSVQGFTRFAALKSSAIAYDYSYRTL